MENFIEIIILIWLDFMFINCTYLCFICVDFLMDSICIPIIFKLPYYLA